MIDRIQGQTFYRIVKTDPPTIEDFTAGSVRGRPIPAHLPVELHRLWDGLSLYSTLAQARRKQRLSPRIGEYIAAMFVPDDSRIQIERTTRESGHHPIWGPPDVMLACVVGVVRADERIERKESR